MGFCSALYCQADPMPQPLSARSAAWAHVTCLRQALCCRQGLSRASHAPIPLHAVVRSLQAASQKLAPSSSPSGCAGHSPSSRGRVLKRWRCGAHRLREVKTRKRSAPLSLSLFLSLALSHPLSLSLSLSLGLPSMAFVATCVATVVANIVATFVSFVDKHIAKLSQIL